MINFIPSIAMYIMFISMWCVIRFTLGLVMPKSRIFVLSVGGGLSGGIPLLTLYTPRYYVKKQTTGGTQFFLYPDKERNQEDKHGYT